MLGQALRLLYQKRSKLYGFVPAAASSCLVEPLLIVLIDVGLAPDLPV